MGLSPTFPAFKAGVLFELTEICMMVPDAGFEPTIHGLTSFFAHLARDSYTRQNYDLQIAKMETAVRVL